MRSQQRRLLLYIFWVSLVSLPALVLVLKITGVATGTNFYDFGAYYNAAERAVYDYPLYDWTTPKPEVTNLPNSPDSFLYPPITVFIFVPFVIFEFSTAAIMWVLISTSVYVVGVVALVRSLDVHLEIRHWVAVITGAIGFGPLVTSVIAGQVTAFLAGMLCLAAASVLSYDQERGSALVGLFTTLPVAIKPFYAPVGTVLLRDYRRLGSALVLGVILLMAGAFIFGVDSTIDYLSVLRHGKGWDFDPDPVQEWNINEFHPLYYFGVFGIVIRVLIFGAVAAIAMFSRRMAFEYVDIYVFALGILAFALGSPAVAPHALTALTPVVVFLIITTYGRNDRILTSVIIAALLIHVHSYAIEFMVTYGPEIVGSQGIVYAVVPLIQPAVWGTLLLAACVSYELYSKFEFRKVRE